ncbi:MAG TPA: AbrB/MazE/SpoVT family DNA-binding domain-containing protein [Candidatus Nanoarchaeia archaeon]|nr:AbrB/MazE/SpoVT family DNA-binding domain-containing protein [Candidatus Nanoarchaeia archaeon]
MDTIKVSSRGQIVIPEEVRKGLGIKEGTKLVLIQRGNRVILERVQDFMKDIEKAEQERLGWMLLGEKGMADIWDNPQDEEVWKQYL